jgi:hypothetical protein
MSIYLDRKYLLLISARLQQFKETAPDLYRFRCPFCGDSKRNMLKARGYIFKAQEYNGYGYKCWNCNISTNFTHFLKFLDPAQYKEYIMERFKDQKPKEETKTAEPEPEPIDSKLIGHRDVSIPSIESLHEDHYARKYIENRKIPREYWSEIYYAEDYKKFLDHMWPNHGKQNLIENDPRIVVFYTNFQGEVTNVTGRSFGADAKFRYITVKVSESRKVFNLHRLKPKDHPVYLLEGQFDAMFLPNAIASGDSNLAGTAEWLLDTLGISPILVFDNEPRNREICKTIRKAIDDGWDVCLFPESFPGKDINEAILAGLTAEEIRRIIDENTVSGLEAQLRLTSWRKS